MVSLNLVTESGSTTGIYNNSACVKKVVNGQCFFFLKYHIPLIRTKLVSFHAIVIHAFIEKSLKLFAFVHACPFLSM